MENKGIVVVTGSSGLIGSALCERLSALGYKVLGFDQEGPPYPPKNVEWIFADLTSDQSVQEAFQIVEDRHGLNIVSCIHLAAYYSFAHEHSPLYKTLTVEGTGRVLRELQRFNCQQFMFSSTMLVMAPSQPGHPINEDSPLLPKWAYPQSKVETEKLIHSKHGKIPALILRIAGVYTDWCQSIPIAHQIERIYERKFTSHFLPGDTSHGQSFVHLDDLVDVFVLAIDKRKQLPPELTLLIGEPETYSYQEIQNEIGQDLYGKDWATYYIPKPIAKAGAWVEDQIPPLHEFIKPWMIDIADDDYELDITRAITFLGWNPKHRLLKALPVMLDNLKHDPLKWYQMNKLHPLSWMKERQHRKSA